MTQDSLCKAICERIELPFNSSNTDSNKAIEAQNLLDKLSNTIADNSLTPQQKEYQLNIIAPQLISYLLYSDYVRIKDFLTTKCGHQRVYFGRDDGIGFISSSRQFITNFDLANLPFPADELFDRYQMITGETIDHATRQLILNSRFFFGAISKDTAVCFYEKTAKITSSTLSTVLSRAVFPFCTLAPA